MGDRWLGIGALALVAFWGERVWAAPDAAVTLPVAPAPALIAPPAGPAATPAVDAEERAITPRSTKAEPAAGPASEPTPLPAQTPTQAPAPKNVTLAPTGPSTSGLGWRKNETYHDWMMRLNAAPYVRSLDPLLREAGQAAGVDPLLLKAIIAVESSYTPDAVSSRGALGLMQIMPDTADRYATPAERQRASSERMLEPRINVFTGARMLADLKRRFGRIDHVMAAWNAGEGTVRKNGGLPPIDQTERHVKQVMELYWALVRHHGSSRKNSLQQPR